jgi:hypothetical protein
MFPAQRHSKGGVACSGRHRNGLGQSGPRRRERWRHFCAQIEAFERVTFLIVAAALARVAVLASVIPARNRSSGRRMRWAGAMPRRRPTVGQTRRAIHSRVVAAFPCSRILVEGQVVDAPGGRTARSPCINIELTILPKKIEDVRKRREYRSATTSAIYRRRAPSEVRSQMHACAGSLRYPLL